MSRRLEAQSSLPPYCCWQLNKSFRREQDQPSKHMRLKEFWQQEFQMLYTSDSHEDWHAFVVEPLRDIIAELTRCPTRIVVSDRQYYCLERWKEAWDTLNASEGIRVQYKA